VCTGDERDPVPIGVPLANCRAYVLDEHRRPVPRGVVGELYVGGAGVAPGYLHGPELDEQRFLRDPYGDGGARMYRTGDFARRDTRGQLHFLGRRDG
jgi:pristinamycin I synthase 3 and 4